MKNEKALTVFREYAEAFAENSATGKVQDLHVKRAKAKTEIDKLSQEEVEEIFGIKKEHITLEEVKEVLLNLFETVKGFSKIFKKFNM